MSAEGFLQQLPDVDPQETAEWIDSLESVAATRGKPRASFLIGRMEMRAEEMGIDNSGLVTTPYINTIPPNEQAWFPGDTDLERRIRAFIRWNAVAMVSRANHESDGIGGHLSTFASSAALYDVGFNHFFRGKSDGNPGDHIYFQGHAAPGIYARAFLEGRFDEEDLHGFRREVSRPGLSSYPHPRLMPDFWEFPTVSMGLGPINSIYHARFNRYLQNRRIDPTDESRVWCFVGDGECDEPETLGSIALAGREGLDNLTWVVNCNLQRLDGPVRGNGKIIQELEGAFRGAGWNVIKVVWGSAWDELISADVDGVLVEKMNTTVDGQFQRYAVEDGPYTREHFFGPDTRLRDMVAHLTDEQIANLPRGGHDYEKLYAAYHWATHNSTGKPTVILAKTIKGWTLGSEVMGRNATHQIKKLNAHQLQELRDRLRLHDVISDSDLAGDDPPFVRLPDGSRELEYLRERRRALGGPIPQRSTRVRRPLDLPTPATFDELLGGSGGQPASTTTAFTRLLRNLSRDPNVGRRIVPIVPDEARTFGMDSLFRELRIYASAGQKYESVDHHLLLSYAESVDGQILEEGITEAGSMASWTAAATSYATRGVPMLPFFIFYSMFGFQRVGDLIWAAADARARGFLLGATAGRTTLAGEGLQHQDGHSLVLASTVPPCQAYDPAFAYETAIIVREGIQRMYGDGEDVFYYLTLYNENYPMPAMPTHLTPEEVTSGIIEGLYQWRPRPVGDLIPASILFSGTAWRAAADAAEILAEDYGVGADLWSVTSYKALREDAIAVERHNRLHPGEPRRVAHVTEALQGDGPIVAVTDFMRMVPDQVAPYSPRPWTTLGTDGFGRSDDRASLRRFFETDAAHVVVAVLSQLADLDTIDASVVRSALERFGVDPDVAPPWTR
ncbi:MAG: pyruvate dehydrogenase (acetyl-transferring), homodimeric type [Microthrixaceae bacterium]|nr:pyruvate dehydrogenase (acetyl-transferring), homodimeric type [Microthrixaceae bacterium]